MNRKIIYDFLFMKHGLTPKRIKVFFSRLKGKSILETAEELNCHPKSIKYYTTSINQSLGVDKVGKWIFCLPFKKIILQNKEEGFKPNLPEKKVVSFKFVSDEYKLPVGMRN